MKEEELQVFKDIRTLLTIEVFIRRGYSSQGKELLKRFVTEMKWRDFTTNTSDKRIEEES